MTDGMRKQWMPKFIQTQAAFLSTLYMASSFDDVIHNRDLKSIDTLLLLQDVLDLIGNDVTDPKTCAADSKILPVLLFIIGQVITREQAALGFYMGGLEAMIRRRGGLDQLDALLASMISLVALEVAIFDERQPKAMYLDYCAARQIRTYALVHTIPESPLFCPHGKYVTIGRSRNCNVQARLLLEDAHNVIDILLDPVSSQSSPWITGYGLLIASRSRWKPSATSASLDYIRESLHIPPLNGRYTQRC